jgi:drug/metabolite transporter (DMT)-like permease
MPYGLKEPVRMAEQNNRLGTLMMIAAVLIFALQDGVSRHLGSHYNTLSIVMLRYWVFLIFGYMLVRRAHGGFAPVWRSPNKGWQVFRGLILAAEICVMQVSFVLLGLIETHAVFVTSPLIVAALSGPILGEKVGWRRWAAIGVGCIGVLIVLNPGSGVFTILALIPLLGAFIYALYALLTRYVGRTDTSAVSFFWMGLIGAIVLTPPGLWYWQPMTQGDSVLMGILCISGLLGHWLLIRSYELAEASAVQPFVYLQLVFIAILGITVFDETLRANVVIGAAIVVGAGLFTLWRQNLRAKAQARADAASAAAAASGPSVPT